MSPEADEDRIGPNGMDQLFKDMNISPDSITALVLAWKVGAGMNSCVTYQMKMTVSVITN
jgi:hypothetical protein